MGSEPWSLPVSTTFPTLPPPLPGSLPGSQGHFQRSHLLHLPTPISGPQSQPLTEPQGSTVELLTQLLCPLRTPRSRSEKVNGTGFVGSQAWWTAGRGGGGPSQLFLPPSTSPRGLLVPKQAQRLPAATSLLIQHFIHLSIMKERVQCGHTEDWN